MANQGIGHEMQAKSEIQFYNEENFLIVARNFFSVESLIEMRSRIKEKREKLESAEHNQKQFGVASNPVRLSPELYDVWKSADVSLLWDVVPQYTNVIYPPTVRTVTEKQDFVPWHQDVAYVQQLGNRAHRSFITCFLPLDDEPFKRPTLEFYIHPQQQPVQHEFLREKEVNFLDLPEDVKPDASQTTHYPLNLGDALLFGQWVLHRTFFPATEFHPRNSVEFRLTTDDSRIEKKDYFNLNSYIFYQHRLG